MNNPLKYIDPSGHCTKQSMLDKINSPYIGMRDDAEKYYDPEEVRRQKESWDRTQEGFFNGLKGAAVTGIGLTAVFCMPATLPVWAAIALGGTGAVTGSMGISDMAEGIQDMYYGMSGDVQTEAINPVRDVNFQGNQEFYERVELAVSVGTGVGGIASTLVAGAATVSAAGEIAKYANVLGMGADVADSASDWMEEQWNSRPFFELDLQFFASEGSNNSGEIIVTEEVIKTAMEGAPLKTQQESVSIPVIQNYVDRILAGETDIPPIKVDGNIIVDGNHRYIASRIAGIEIDIQPWSGGNSDKVLEWIDMILDYFDWGNR